MSLAPCKHYRVIATIANSKVNSQAERKRNNGSNDWRAISFSYTISTCLRTCRGTSRYVRNVPCPRSISDRGSKVDVRWARCSSCNLLRINQRSEESASVPLHSNPLWDPHATVCLESLFIESRTRNRTDQTRNLNLTYHYGRRFSAKFRDDRETFSRRFLYILLKIIITVYYRVTWRSIAICFAI